VPPVTAKVTLRLAADQRQPLGRDEARRIAANIAKPQKHARYESIHKAAQYKNSGAIQIGIMNGSDVITMSLKEDFQCSRRAAPEGGMRAKLHSLIQKKVRPLHEGSVKIPQRAPGFDWFGESCQIDRGKNLILRA